jgi:N-acyl homoserine lactone hydrolase
MHRRWPELEPNMINITVTPYLVADLLAGDERMPVNVHVIDHPDARILVDTGIRELHPLAADMEPRLYSFDIDPHSIDVVVNTHLHFDHCGNNHLFADKPIYVQRRELEDARRIKDYTIPEWVDPPGISYQVIEGQHQLLPGIRLLPAPGHSDGLQILVIDTGEHPTIVGGDVAVWFGELEDPSSEGQKLVRGLEPKLVWLTHVSEPWPGR